MTLGNVQRIRVFENNIQKHLWQSTRAPRKNETKQKNVENGTRRIHQIPMYMRTTVDRDFVVDITYACSTKTRRGTAYTCFRRVSRVAKSLFSEIRASPRDFTTKSRRFRQTSNRRDARIYAAQKVRDGGDGGHTCLDENIVLLEDHKIRLPNSKYFLLV